MCTSRPRNATRHPTHTLKRPEANPTCRNRNNLFHILVDTPVFLTSDAPAYNCHRASIANVDQLTGHRFRSLLTAGPFDCT